MILRGRVTSNGNNVITEQVGAISFLLQENDGPLGG